MIYHSIFSNCARVYALILCHWAFCQQIPSCRNQNLYQNECLPVIVGRRLTIGSFTMVFIVESTSCINKFMLYMSIEYFSQVYLFSLITLDRLHFFHTSTCYVKLPNFFSCGFTANLMQTVWRFVCSPYSKKVKYEHVDIKFLRH